MLIILLLLTCCNEVQNNSNKMDPELLNKAEQLASQFLIIDTHIDLPYRLEEEWEDISERTEKGHFDYPRAKLGGLNAAFLSIYVPAKFEGIDGGKDLAESLIRIVEEITADNHDKFRIALSVEDVRNNFNKGIISFPLGMENGTPIEGEIRNLQYFYDRGIRYIGLAHSKSNHLGDSSYDENRQWNGLSDFGENVVREMNRLGIIVDVSHLSDSTFYDVIKVSSAPVIASHSSCRYFTKGWERNMDDMMIKKLAEYGGIIMINFGSSFLDNDFRVGRAEWKKKVKKRQKKNELDEHDEKTQDYIKSTSREYKENKIYVSQLVDHIDHVVKIVGIDYVGFGSDFDGVSDLPIGLEDVTKYPNIIYELLKRNYSEEDIQKICSGNLLRVWSEVEDVSKRIQLIED
ncbi:MAG: dipeptidase [Ignavibacterium sp.]|nr:MAG: dipeptidase [Ignavibacterium sp.]